MSITRINRFTAAEGSAEMLHALLATIVPLIKASDGCLGVQLLRNITDPNELMILETWADQAAHLTSMKHIPPEALKQGMALMAGPPTGAYYHE